MNARHIVLLAVLALAGPGRASAQDAKPAKFEDVVEAKFRSWDKDGDGKLSAQEIDALVVSHGLTGDEAAAVAAIHAFYRDHARTNPVTRPQLTAKGAAKKGTARSIAELYEDFREHLRTVPREVFAGSSGPALEGMQQGDMGDCYFIAVVGAAVHHDAARVKHMFHPQKDGSCEVVFPGGARAVVPKLTDAQIALGSTAGKQGLWLNVLEEAYSRVQFKKTPKKEKKSTDLPEDLIARGGDSEDTIQLMTVNRVNGIDFKESRAPHHVLQQKVVTALKGVAAARRLMTAGAPASKTLPPGIDDDHEYAVLGFDAKTETVVLWNPHGEDFKPKQSPPGLKNGYETRSGRFEVPVADFMKIFDGVTWETGEPRKK